MNIGQLKSLSETCARSCHMSLVGGDTFLASQRREMLVPDWLDLCTADKVDQPLLLASLARPRSRSILAAADAGAGSGWHLHGDRAVPKH